MFYHQYSTKTRVRSNPEVGQLLEQCTSSPKESDRTVRKGRNCEHQGGWRARVDGMANICEPLINAVKTNKPKVLTGLDQHARKRASYQWGEISYFLWERKYAQRLTCPRKGGKDQSMTPRRGINGSSKPESLSEQSRHGES